MNEEVRECMRCGSGYRARDPYKPVFLRTQEKVRICWSLEGHRHRVPPEGLGAAPWLLLFHAATSHCWRSVSAISHVSDSLSQCSQLPPS